MAEENLQNQGGFAAAAAAGLGTNSASSLGNLKRPQNWVNKLEIDKNMGQDPVADVAKAQWLLISQGVQSVTYSSNDKTQSVSFWNDKGFEENDVTSKKISFQIKGSRVVGDPAQDFIASKLLDLGDDCRTLFRWTNQSGHVLTANVTISKVVTMGGNANADQSFSFELDLNGKPVESDDGTSLDGVKGKDVKA